MEDCQHSEMHIGKVHPSPVFDYESVDQGKMLSFEMW